LPAPTAPLRESLAAILYHPRWPEGWRPHPDGWRARPPYASRAGTLPHYPFVSHRGGFPDGS
jgi:hypothetical protein